jgi:SAM-dependent methyltransferase
MKNAARPASVLVYLLFVLLALNGCATGADAGPEPSDEMQQLFETLGLETGQEVADVGAGNGPWVPALSHWVGREGHVFATEVKEDLVDKIRGRAQEEGLANVTVLLGNDQDMGLPPACCDAVLLRLVYHHFTDPAAMRASLRRALRSGGRVAVIDIEPQKSWSTLEGVPDRGGHGIPMEDLIREMSGEGFSVESRHTDWNGDPERFCVIFKKRALP